MLMITVETDAATLTFRLDGRLAGHGVRELARNWSSAAFNQPHQRVLFDLTGVSFIDDLGREFLARVHRRGGRLVGGVTTKAIVEEIPASSILEVAGTLRAPVTVELRQSAHALLGRGERRILLDLSRLSDIDAAGVGELVRAFNTTNAAGGVLQIAHASRRVSQLLHIAGVLQFLTMHIAA